MARLGDQIANRPKSLNSLNKRMPKNGLFASGQKGSQQVFPVFKYIIYKVSPDTYSFKAYRCLSKYRYRFDVEING